MGSLPPLTDTVTRSMATPLTVVVATETVAVNFYNAAEAAAPSVSLPRITAVAGEPSNHA